MKLKIFQVDAFAETPFSGNPAAVVPLESWLSEHTMQQVAMENNLSETVFFVPVPGRPIINSSADPLVIDNVVSEGVPHYEIRWFTPEVEVNLCGHATLAAAYVLFNIIGHPSDAIAFHSASGELVITKDDDYISMNFPRWKPEPLAQTPAMLGEVLNGTTIIGAHQSRDLLVELPDENAVNNCTPDFSAMKRHFDSIIITAPGAETDFVSRFFAPASGIDEDPVTGSAHSQLIPFWSERTGKKVLTAKQLSKRGGQLYCEDLGERVAITGKCQLFLVGEIYLDAAQQ